MTCHDITPFLPPHTPTLSRKASLDPHKRSDSFLSGNPESQPTDKGAEQHLPSTVPKMEVDTLMYIQCILFWCCFPQLVSRSSFPKRGPWSASCMFCQASSERVHQCGKHPTSGTLLACFLSYVCLQASQFGAPKRKPNAATPREFPNLLEPNVEGLRRSKIHERECIQATQGRYHGARSCCFYCCYMLKYAKDCSLLSLTSCARSLFIVWVSSHWFDRLALRLRQ